MESVSWPRTTPWHGTTGLQGYHKWQQARIKPGRHQHYSFCEGAKRAYSSSWNKRCQRPYIFKVLLLLMVKKFCRIFKICTMVKLFGVNEASPLCDQLEKLSPRGCCLPPALSIRLEPTRHLVAEHSNLLRKNKHYWYNNKKHTHTKKNTQQ